MGQAERVAARLVRGDHHARRGVRGRGEKLGMQVELDAEAGAPALQLHQAVGLARRGALGQRQAAGLRKYDAVVDRLDPDLGAVAPGDLDEALMAQVGPGRGEREVVVDGLGHGRIPLGFR